MHSGEQLVLSSDESLFTLFRADMKVPVSIDVIRDRYAANCVLEYDRFGGGSVMVWAGIRHDGAVGAQVYRDEIPQHHVVPLINVIRGIFQYDNVRSHTAQVYRDEILQHHVGPLINVMVVYFSTTMSGHTLHRSTGMRYCKSAFKSYHGQQDWLIYPQENTYGIF